MVSHGVTGCYMVLQGVTWCYMVLQGVTWCYRVLHGVTWCYRVLHSVTGCYMVLQGVTWCYQVFQSTVNSRLADTPLLQTLDITDKIQIHIYGLLTENDCRYYGLSLLRTQNDVPRVLACQQAPRLGKTRRNWSRREGKNGGFPTPTRPLLSPRPTSFRFSRPRSLFTG